MLCFLNIFHNPNNENKIRYIEHHIYTAVTIKIVYFGDGQFPKSDRDDKMTFTSARQTLLSFFRSVLALFKAFLLLSTGTLIMGVFILELATIRISLSLRDRMRHAKTEKD